MLTTGTQLGRYEIRSQLGAGGMGEVYLAHDTQLDRTVALKILPSEIATDPQRLRRFAQEARAAAALKHSNIAHIYEIGEAQGQHFIAMEYVEGLTLNARINESPLAVSEIVQIGIQLADALDEAHAKGVTHRDIKSSNIMITPRGQAKLLDFGLAKVRWTVEQERSDDATTQLKTAEGIVIGTVMYMSPEQALGQAVDHRSDIFSLGAVLYEMATGRLPFTGSTTTEIIERIVHAQPEGVSRFNYDVPAELERIIRKCLEKDKDRRYQSARELLVDLENLKRDSEPGSLMSKKTEPPRKNRFPLWVLAAVALLVIALAAIGNYLLRHRSQPAETGAIESIAVLPFVNESGNSDVEYLSDGMTESLINSLSRLPLLSVKARSSVFRYKGKNIEPLQVAAELSVQAILNGRVVQRGDDLTLYLSLVDGRNGNQLWGEQYNRKLTDLVALQSEIANDVSSKLRARLSGADKQKLTKNYTQNTEAYQAYLKGLYYWNKGPAPGYEKSRDYFQQAIDLDPSYALAYSGLASYYSFAAANGHLPSDENWPKAEAAANKALALDETLAEPYNPLAAVKLYYYRDWPAAERYFRRGIELDPNFAEIHNHYALCLYLFGRNEEALTEIQRAIELEPLSLRFSLSRARILFFIRQYDRAIDQYRKTLELDQNFALAHEWLGDAYEQKGMHREAIAEWSKALTLSGEAEQASLLERTYAASGFETAVRALAQRKLERLNEKTGRGEYVPAAEYVTVYLRLGDKEKVFGWLAKADEERNWFVLDFKVNPIFDSLRSDPRFADLVRRVGL